MPNAALVVRLTAESHFFFESSHRATTHTHSAFYLVHMQLRSWRQQKLLFGSVPVMVAVGGGCTTWASNTNNKTNGVR